MRIALDMRQLKAPLGGRHHAASSDLAIQEALRDGPCHRLIDTGGEHLVCRHNHGGKQKDFLHQLFSLVLF